MRCAGEAQGQRGRSRADELREQGDARCRAHVAELATNQDSIEVNAHCRHYQLVPEHLRYKDLRYVQNDVLFVHADYRNGAAGGRLMRATRDVARQRGAKRITWHCKPTPEAMVHMHEAAAKSTALHRLLDRRE